MLCEAREKLTTTPLLSKLFIMQSVKNSPPTGEVATDCNHKICYQINKLQLSDKIEGMLCKCNTA